MMRKAFSLEGRDSHPFSFSLPSLIQQQV